MHTFAKGGAAAIGALLGLLLIIGIVVGIGYAQAWWIRNPGVEIANARTDAMRESNQYTTAQVTRLNTLLTEYQDSDTAQAQKIAILNEMWNIKGTVAEERLSPELIAFFSTHPRGTK